MKNFIKMISVFTCLLVFANHANAVLSIKIDDGVSFVEATDTDGDGIVNINSALGSWVLNVIVGTGTPTIGSSSYTAIDLFSVNVSGGVGDLSIYLTQTGLDTGPSSYNIAVGGTTDGTAIFESFVDSTNAKYGEETRLSELGPFTAKGSAAAVIAGTDGGVLAMTGSYSWTIAATISHTAGGQATSFDYNVRIPEPHTLGLLGLGLLGFGFFSRKKNA